MAHQGISAVIHDSNPRDVDHDIARAQFQRKGKAMNDNNQSEPTTVNDPFYTCHRGPPTNAAEWRNQNFRVGAHYAQPRHHD
jgi:hypothetical protein